MIVLLGGEKGGEGKSTLAVHLAEARTGPTPRRSVVLLDADKQESASTWAAARIEAKLTPLPVRQSLGVEVAEVARDLAMEYDDVVIDAPGRDSVELRAAMLAADVLVVPVRIGAFSAWTLEKMEGHLVGANEARAEAGKRPLRALMILNAVNPRATRRNAEARAFLAGYELELAEGMIGTQVAFDEAIGQGRTVRELVRKIPGPEWIASREIAGLVREVFANGDD